MNKSLGEEGPEFYDTHIPESPQRWKELYNRAADLIPLGIPRSRHRVREPSRILELGCGPGFFAKVLYDRGHRNYCGVDFSSVCIEQARERVPEFKFIVGNLLDKKVQAMFSDYNIFVLLEVLEHIVRDLDILKAIPVGKVIIFSVPSRGSTGTVHVRKFRRWQVRPRYGSLIGLGNVPLISWRYWLGHGRRI